MFDRWVWTGLSVALAVTLIATASVFAAGAILVGPRPR